jgi:hypothetical protein
MGVPVVVSLNLVEKVRGVGISAIVDGALCLVPRDHVDGIMSGLLDARLHFVDSDHYCDSALLESATPSWS